MVFGLVSAIAGFVKVQFLVDKAVIDNLVFRLHYRVTSALFFLFCILCTAHGLFGPPIDCIFDDKKNEHVINTYCWVMSTFSVVAHEDPRFQLGKHVAHQGVGPAVSEDDLRVHKYYQWVPFVLFLQGILFYVPHWIWKKWEGGKVPMISDGLRGTMAETRAERLKTQSRLVQYLTESISLHNVYAFGYFFCEILNFLNVMLNIFLTNKFLGGLFLSFGMEAIGYQGETHYNYAMARVFPRVTKCTFHKYGPSGTIQNVDSMCVLALNIINEKIYVFLWFWFIILAILSGLAVLYSTAILAMPQIRTFILERRFKFRVPNGADILVSKTEVGDFLLLHLLGQNINSTVYGDILNQMTNELCTPYNAVPRGHVEMAPIYPTKDLMPQ